MARLMFERTAQAATKHDSSPAIINHYLRRDFPNDSVVSEESAQELARDAAMLEQTRQLCSTALQQEMTDAEILSLIDYGQQRNRDRFWTLDPIDGTKGFLRGGQFAVCLALILDGAAELGVLGCPNLSNGPSTGCILVAERGKGAAVSSLDADAWQSLHPQPLHSIADATFCESVEAAHSSHSVNGRIAAILGMTRSVRMDSQCKYALLARGDAHVYLRFNDSYIENIWDHAAGSLLVEETGGAVADTRGRPLDFSTGAKLTSNRGVVAVSDRRLLPLLLQAIAKL